MLSGPPRSGTTYFSALLDGHPQVNWLPDEGFFFEHFYRLKQRNLESLLVGGTWGSIDYFVEGLRDRLIVPNLNQSLSDFPDLKVTWSEERFCEELREIGLCKDAAAVWRTLLRAFLVSLDQAPREFVTMKAADFGCSAFGALQCLDDSKSILIVREPIAAINSLKRYRQRSNRRILTWPTLLETLLSYESMANDYINLPEHAKDRILVVKYEELIDDQESTLRHVVDFAGISWNASLKTPSMLGVRWKSNSSFVDKMGLDSAPERRPITLSASERATIRDGTSLFRTVFNYDVST